MPTPTGLWLTVLHLAAPAAPDAHDLHAATEALWDGLPWPPGARPLWSQPRPDTIVVQGPAPLTHTAPAGWALTAHSIPVTIPPAGARISLSLIANPTRVTTLTTPEGAERKPRHALPETDWAAWLTRHLQPALDLTGRIGHRKLPAARGHHHGRAGTVTHARAMFHATATVTDPERLAALTAAGVGHGKAYGCGLLLIRQVPA